MVDFSSIVDSLTELLNTPVFGLFKVSDFIIFAFMLMLVFTIFKVMNHS